MFRLAATAALTVVVLTGCTTDTSDTTGPVTTPTPSTTSTVTTQAPTTAANSTTTTKAAPTTTVSTTSTLPTSVDAPTSTSTTAATSCAGVDAHAYAYGGDILFAPGTKLEDYDEGLVSPVLADAEIKYYDLALEVDCVGTDMSIWGGESLIEHCVDCDESVVPDLLHIVMTSKTDDDTGLFIDHVWAVFNRWDASSALGDALAFRLIDGNEGSDGVAPIEEWPSFCWSTAYDAPVVFTTDAREVAVKIVRAWAYQDAGSGLTWHPVDSAVLAPPRDPPTPYTVGSSCTQSDGLSGSSVICDC